MTTAVSEALTEYFRNHGFVQLTTTTCAIAVILLLVVAVEREMIRAMSPEAQKRNVAAFFVVIVPMAITFAAAVTARFIHLS